MIRFIKSKSVALTIFISLTLSVLLPSTVANAAIACGQGQIYDGTACVTQISVGPLPQVSTDSSEIAIVLDVLFGLIGAISLLIITIAGFRYIVSRGEPQEIAKAKNAILYAIIGLVVAILAVTIVNFVVGNL